MILAPMNNISSPAPSNSGVQNSISLNSANVSSRDLASVSQFPTVNVSLSSSNAVAASSSAGIPPIYSKPKVAAINQAQVSPSRSNASSDGLAENSILSGTKASDEAKNEESSSKKAETDEKSVSNESSDFKLSEDELKMIEELKARDREVKAHEQAHKAVGGQYTGAISYNYQSGPDGKRYAVGGEVPIDVSPISGDPQATITKMTIVRAAATAPAEPSAQDLSVAAQASMLLAEAQAELTKVKSEDLKKEDSSSRDDELSENQRSSVAEKGINSFISVSNTDVSNENFIDAVV